MRQSSITTRRRSLFISVVAGLAAIVATGCAAESEADSAESNETAEEALTAAQCASRASDARCRLEGVVESMFVGEIDASVVGDACVTIVRAGTKRYGLVRAVQSCPDADRFAGGDVAVSFSKGDLKRVSRRRTDVLKARDVSATYYEFGGVLAESKVDVLAAFDALDHDAKVAALYSSAPGAAWGTLRAGFQQKAIRIDTTLTGPVKTKALAAYRELAEYSTGNGGGRPKVFAIEKDGKTYAYAIEVGGRSYGDWGQQTIFDRFFVEVGQFGFSD